jgi:mRNA interferase RelE/StbE
VKLIATPRFARATKKLHPEEKQALDEALRVIAAEPEIGEMKRGDLAGVQVYTYRDKPQHVLLAYRVAHAEDAIKLLAKLVPLIPATKKRKLGLLAGKLSVPADFDAPLRFTQRHPPTT